ncbi:MAG TPA: DUF4230 domain-containing protein [Pseudonocardiaceae bacterium]|nr:DUF4230 domain-containing protein [Pseudonocardiaceae bacterium]
MPQLLGRDTVEFSARPDNRRRIRGKLVAVAVGIVVLVPVGTQLGGYFPHWGNPFAQQVLDHSPAPLLLALQNLSQYHAATGTFEVVLDVEHDTAHVSPLISGERTTFLGRGSVDTTVDFSNVGADRVTVSPDRQSVSISLPAARLASAVVDPAASRVVGRQRGFFNRIASVFESNPTSEQELYQLASAKLTHAAEASDLNRRGEENTRQMLTTLARSFGFTQVTVTFDAPSTSDTTNRANIAS